MAPLFESWSQLFNSDFTVYCRDNITRNRSYWESVLNENIKIEDSKEERSNLVKIRESEDGFFFQESEDPSKISQPRRYRAHPPQKVPILKRSATISEGKRQDLLDVHSSRNILKSNGNIRNSGESIMKM